MKRTLVIATLVAVSGALSAQQLVFTNPAAGTLVPIGKRCVIGWSATSTTNRTVRIAVSMSGAGSDRSVANLVPVEAGQYEWDIPWEVTPATPCHFKAVIFDGTNEVEKVDGPAFSIVSNPAPALLLRAPAGGEAWPRGTTRSVAWEPHNLSGTLTLDLLQGGAVVDSVANLPVASNRCHYTLPASLPTGTNYSIRLSSAAVPAVSATSQPFQATDQTPPRRKWTVLLYLDADAFMMEENTMQSIVDLGLLHGSTNVNYVLQVDRSPTFAFNYGPWYDTKRFILKPGLLPTPEFAVQSLGEMNMSAPDTLTDFINWGTENFPADNYFLILSDHGDGWFQGQILDESNGNHDMPMKGVSQALNAADARMTILGLDMCVMGQIEVAHQARNTGAQIIIASQYIETRNWPYLTVFQQLQDKLDVLSPEDLAILFCDGFVKQYSDPTVNATLAATRLDKMDALTAAVASFADEMMTNATDQAAVRLRAAAAKAAFREAVIHCAQSPLLNEHVHGLNINFPTDPDSPYFTEYSSTRADFAEDAHWKAFLTYYLSHLTNTWISTARALAQTASATDLDFYRFADAIQPATNTSWVNFLAVGSGNVFPFSGNIQMTNGTTLTVSAIGSINTNMYPMNTNHFVRWLTSGQVELGGDPRQATNTLTVHGDGLVMAFFAQDKERYEVTFTTEGNGHLETASTSATNIITETVNSGGNCQTITAVPDPGYTFAGWGGDYPATANPFTLTNVQANMTVIAYFWPARPALSITCQPSAVTLTWPAWTLGYVLEATGDLPGGSWAPVPGVTTNRVTLPLSATNQFFRLNLPTDGWHSPYPYRFF